MTMEMNSKELHRFELIACLDMQLHGGQEPLKARLQTIPDGWRRYRAITAMLARLVSEIYTTMPERRVRYMETLCAHGEVLVRIKPAAKSDENVLVPVSALREIVNRAMLQKCRYCFEDRAGIKACELRKALIECAPPIDLNLGECPYRHVVENCEEGEYI